MVEGGWGVGGVGGVSNGRRTVVDKRTGIRMTKKRRFKMVVG